MDAVVFGYVRLNIFYHIGMPGQFAFWSVYVDTFLHL